VHTLNIQYSFILIANEQETLWRATAAYLMAQYFLTLNGDRHNLNLEGLTKIYNDIEKRIL
jgi:hypothetical protein